MKTTSPLAILPLFLMMACSDSTPQTESTTATQTASPVAPSTAHVPNYIVVSQPSYPPFSSRAENGQIVGLDMDLLNAIAQKEGFSVTFLPHDMAGLLETLDKGHADIVATGEHHPRTRSQIRFFTTIFGSQLGGFVKQRPSTNQQLG